MSNDKEEILQGEPVSDVDLFYINWGRESIKENISLANELLKQLITLCIALLGVSLIYDKILTYEFLRFAVICFFFLGLIISFLGVLPFEKKIDVLSPSKIREYHQIALKHKLKYIWIASAAIVMGFAIIIAELLVSIIV